ncbi:hypothetical protein P7K49_026824 [Saguinus oedipus]|uniref:Angiopoietin-1/2/4 domain-containing protein n=1 Tax=Saguinus oedipus TaxID=9490 RepID=A0ABQ9UFR7_SAGOE|nr:hypothetical protein P7K49_026824 [Saguinus oedipus]
MEERCTGNDVRMQLSSVEPHMRLGLLVGRFGQRTNKLDISMLAEVALPADLDRENGKESMKGFRDKMKYEQYIKNTITSVNLNDSFLITTLNYGHLASDHYPGVATKKELDTLKEEKENLQSLVTRQTYIIYELEKQLSRATTNNTILQRQQLELMDTVHNLFNLCTQEGESMILSAGPSAVVFRIHDTVVNK